MFVLASIRRVRHKGLVFVLTVALLALGVVPPGQALTAGPGAGADPALATPEHPEGTSFNPNEIKDIKAADPGAGVNLIEAPSAIRRRQPLLKTTRS